MEIKILNKYKQEGLLYNQVHPTLPLTIWNYTDKCQWENLWDEVTLNCRGRVTDDLGNVVARPFKKFFNLSEGKTKVIDEYEIYTKYDGSLGILFWYKTLWVFASRGSFTSDQAVRGFEMLSRYDLSLLDKGNTYCFEIIFKENKIVVDYGEYEDVVLTGVFNTQTGEEQSANCWLLPHAKTHKKDTPLIDLHKVIKDTEEGYVIRFSNGERCKVKGAEYLRLHKMMSEMSTTAVWDCLRNGDSILNILDGYPDEFYNSVKEYEEELQTSFNWLLAAINAEYKLINKKLGEMPNKTFADKVKNNKFKSFLFLLRNGRNITEQVWKFIKPEYKKL